MLQDPMSLLSAYMQGSRFAQENIDNFRKREEEDNKQMVQKGLGVLSSYTTRVNPKTGKTEMRPENEIWSDPNFLRDFSNTALGQQVLREGLSPEDQDRVHKIVPLRATQISANKAGAPEYGIEVQWQDKDGNPISQGPIAIDANGRRSASNDAMVVPIKTSDVMHAAISKGYQYNPELARDYQKHLLNASQQSLINEWMQNPDQRRDIEQQYAMAGGNPAYFKTLQDMENGRKPYTTVDTSGVITEHGPDKSQKPVGFDPTAAGYGSQASDVETDRLIKRQAGLKEGGLRFEESTADRQLKLQAEQIANQLKTNLDFKVANSATERKLKADDLTNTYITQLGLDKQYAPDKLQLLRDEISARILATADADSKAAPTTVATANYRTEKTEEFRRTLNAQDGARFDTAMNQLGSNDPVEQQKGRQTIQSLTGDPAKADEFIKQKGATRTLRSALDSNFNGMTPEQTTQLVAKNFAQMPKADQKSFQQGLMAGAQRGDSNAVIALNTTLFPQTAGSGGKGKTPEPPKFNSEEVVKYAKASGEMDEQQVGQAAARARQIFDTTLANLAQRMPLDQINGADLNVASALATRLEAKGLANTADTLYLRESLERQFPGVTGTPEEFADELVLPLGNQIKAAGRAPTPQILSEATLDASALRFRGLRTDDAIALATQLSDPVEARRVAEEAGRAGFTTPEAVYDYIAKKFKDRPQPTMGDRVRGLQDAVNSADPVTVVPRVGAAIAEGWRGLRAPPSAGAAPSYYQGR